MLDDDADFAVLRTDVDGSGVSDDVDFNRLIIESGDDLQRTVSLDEIRDAVGAAPQLSED